MGMLDGMREVPVERRAAVPEPRYVLTEEQWRKIDARLGEVARLSRRVAELEAKAIDPEEFVGVVHGRIERSDLHGFRERLMAVERQVPHDNAARLGGVEAQLGKAGRQIAGLHDREAKREDVVSGFQRVLPTLTRASRFADAHEERLNEQNGRLQQLEAQVLAGKLPGRVMEQGERLRKVEATANRVHDRVGEWPLDLYGTLTGFVAQNVVVREAVSVRSAGVVDAAEDLGDGWMSFADLEAGAQSPQDKCDDPAAPGTLPDPREVGSGAQDLPSEADLAGVSREDLVALALGRIRYARLIAEERDRLRSELDRCRPEAVTRLLADIRTLRRALSRAAIVLDRWDLTHRDDRERVLAAVNEALAGLPPDPDPWGTRW